MSLRARFETAAPRAAFRSSPGGRARICPCAAARSLFIHWLNTVATSSDRPALSPKPRAHVSAADGLLAAHVVTVEYSARRRPLASGIWAAQASAAVGSF